MNQIIAYRIYSIHILLVFLYALTGCACSTKSVKPAVIELAQEQIQENALMDVGIVPFDSENLSEEDAFDEGTSLEIRKAEGLFIPCHLKNTLQKSKHWGAVRVVPSETVSDLLVKGHIERSDGERLIVKIDVVDATGKTWFKKRYKAKAGESAFSDSTVGEKDAFQNLYNTIANDMADFKKHLTPEQINAIRSVSRMRFAAQLAPDTFEPYLTVDKKGQVQLNRFPADNDPMMTRVAQVHQRDGMYLDTLNELYSGFYNDMWTSYHDWRLNNLTERAAMRKINRDAWLQGIIGVLLIGGAIAMEAGDVDNVSILQGVMVAGGGALIINGINVSKQKEMHAVSIKELSDSFGDTMKPVVMDIEGEQVKLSGSAKEQYAQWQNLLRRIYLEETGYSSTEEFQPESAPDFESEPEGEAVEPEKTIDQQGNETSPAAHDGQDK